MRRLRYLMAAFICLSLAAPATAGLTLGKNRATPRIISISPGPTEQEAGERLLDAVAAIGDASSTRPYVIMLDPGGYDLGDNSLIMKSWVSIRGSGRASTRISGDNINYLVRTASHTDIGGLSLENRGGTNRARTLYSYNVAAVTIHDVAVTAANGSAITVGIWNEKASPTIRNVTVDCTGVENANVDGIVNKDGASPSIWHADVFVDVPDNGLGSGISGNTNCSPDIYDVTVQVTVAESGRAQGLYFLGHCFPRINRARVYVTGGDDIVGIFNSSESFLTLQNIRAQVNGKETASTAYGILCSSSSTFDLDRGRIGVQGAALVVGVKGAQSSSDFVMSIRRSTIHSTGDSIENAVGLTVRVASTVIVGPIKVSFPRPFHCINCTDYYYNPLDDDCLPIP